jgi:hypothetical protein
MQVINVSDIPVITDITHSPGRPTDNTRSVGSHRQNACTLWQEKQNEQIESSQEDLDGRKVR